MHQTALAVAHKQCIKAIKVRMKTRFIAQAMRPIAKTKHLHPRPSVVVRNRANPKRNARIRKPRDQLAFDLACMRIQPIKIRITRCIAAQ